MDFDCYNFDPNRISEDRFYKGIVTGDRSEMIGESEWANKAGQSLFLNDEAVYAQLIIDKEERIKDGILKKKVFISHRQTDRKKAKWLANYFKSIQVDTWLDIIDLKIVSDNPKNTQPIAIANMIEMALLNCTHVVALMTPRSAGSAWIPYEFGRVKSRNLGISNAKAFQYKLSGKDLPEYMLLTGKPLKSGKDIDNWIR
jgi:hypothetical protein